MNNTIYNDIKNIYRFIFKNYILFLIGLLVFFFILLAVTIFSFKFAYYQVAIEYKTPDKIFEINESFKYPLHIGYKENIERLNLNQKSAFLNANNLSEHAAPIIKEFVKTNFYSTSDQYQLYEIDFNHSNLKDNMVLILKKKFFANDNILYENISERIVILWNDYKKKSFDLLDWRQKRLYTLNETDRSLFSYTFVSKLKIEYFNIFLIFLFIIFNVVSIIMIKEIKNDNIK